MFRSVAGSRRDRLAAVTHAHQIGRRMNTFDDGDRESSSPLDFGVADVITTTLVYLTCTVAVYVLCTFVEDAVDEPVTHTADGARTQAAASPVASVSSETSVAGAGPRPGAGSRPGAGPRVGAGPGAGVPGTTAAPSLTPPAPPVAAQPPPAETGDASPAAAVPDMGREKRRR